LQHHPHPIASGRRSGTGRRSGRKTPHNNNFFLSIIFLTSFYYFSPWAISPIALATITIRKKSFTIAIERKEKSQIIKTT